MPAGLLQDLHIEFALEDALCHHGLIDTPRPAHPDFSDNQEQGQDTMTTKSLQEDQPLFHLAEIDGTTTLFATLDAMPEEVVSTKVKAGHNPNGYFLENLAQQLLLESNISTDDIEFDSEAGMFSLLGTAATLQLLKKQLTGLFSDTTQLQQTLKQAKRQVQTSTTKSSLPTYWRHRQVQHRARASSPRLLLPAPLKNSPSCS